MVKLDKIYTKGGDKGMTSLATGSRIAKQSLRVCAIGDVDEANATIGVARLASDKIGAGMARILSRIQNDLFDLGADIATPGDDPADGTLRIQMSQVDRLEREIDAVNEVLDPLTSFVLPGGTALAARLHLARTVARRAERSIMAMAEAEPVNAQAMAYINRLSDLLFVLARDANDGGRKDVLWRPGMTAKTEILPD
ncbi:cob(I)yrinic acid a,c-diamide adenosyltransferase [Alphaproteobacteria bacterium]|nr:cob(I)yrinic acid a,c-diamide adenosyltransferase [Alphaproteobacteria bacterium]